ncbi:MAG: NAD(P)H-quinone oxidoreductase [Hyphomicrobiales bacterium]|nr:NAD(P)H-quinone oxidoreductase [Hyphomicrobiales bacterium]
MKAIVTSGAGGPDVMSLGQAPRPAPGRGQILIQTAAAGVNRPDVLQRQGLYPPPPGAPEILGLEAAGVVAALGEGVERYRLGDRVCALLSGGGYAEYCVADEGSTLPIPKGLSMAEAASLPETFFTVAHNVFGRGALKAGETFLVHGGASGIGVAAIQTAKAFGARVLATAGSPEKCAMCLKLGAERAINHRTEDFVEAAKAATDGRGVDLILDMVGGDYIERNIRACAEDARIVQIAFLQGSRASVDFMRVMLKRITITGSTLRARPAQVKAGIAQGLEAMVWPLIEAGQVRAVIDSTFPLAEAAAAHARMESNAHMGKIILTI